MSVRRGLSNQFRRVARAFDLAGITNTVGATSLGFLAKGGNRKCQRQVGLITVHNKIKWHTQHRRPTLAKTQGWGTLGGNGARKIVKGGPPATDSSICARNDAGAVTVSISWTKPAGRGSMKAGEDFFSSSCRVIQALVQTFMVPALRKLREERSTSFVGDANEIKGRATRPLIL
ncbi:MAG TPA: hypothetical protein VHV29_04060 [Terriglobales bacterium]|nr:hypothetical protein [Terriglobales bacterium]